MRFIECGKASRLVPARFAELPYRTPAAVRDALLLVSSTRTSPTNTTANQHTQWKQACSQLGSQCLSEPPELS